MKLLPSRGFAKALLHVAILTLSVGGIVFYSAAQSSSGQNGSSSPNPPPATTPQSQTGGNGPVTEKTPPPTQSSKDKSSDTTPTDASTTKVRLRVTNNQDKPVSNASVYVRFNEPGGLFHKDHLAEMNFKTNDDGSVKIPEVPIGRVLIQIVAKGYHTYGKWYDIAKDPDPISIKLDPPPHWY
ncbi:MAG: carboxypeptidase-like regulatory domain-containing protein [Candidatus Acidiferrales bacterium]